MSYHPVTKQITDLLAEHHVPFRTFEHAPVRTSEEAMALRPEFTMHQGAKALIVKAKATDNNPFFAMLVFPGDRKFDSKKTKAAINAKSISFATEEEVAQVTGGIEPVSTYPPPATPADCRKAKEQERRRIQSDTVSSKRQRHCGNQTGPEGLRLFSARHALLLGAVARATVSSSRLARDKHLATRAGEYVEIGSGRRRTALRQFV